MWFGSIVLNGVFFIFFLKLDLASFDEGIGLGFDGVCFV